MHLRSERYSVVNIPSNEYLNIGNKSEYSVVVVVYGTRSYPVTIRFILKILMNYYRRFAQYNDGSITVWLRFVFRNLSPSTSFSQTTIKVA